MIRIEEHFSPATMEYVLRPAEWLLIIYFAGVTVTAWGFGLPQRLFEAPALLAICAAAFLFCALGQRRFSKTFRTIRDWLTLPFLIAAYRAMNWFTPASRDYHLERLWVTWDRMLLHDGGLKAAIEIFGPLLPGILELSYLLVYVIGPVTLAMLYVYHHEERSGEFLFIYLLGALITYSLFPYFPSDPPRVVFPSTDFPIGLSVFRRLNLFICGRYGIHSSVFPSAHVSSAFSGAFGLITTLPERRRVGGIALAYAVIVTIATIYGRYHYAIDGVAGMAVSVITWQGVLYARRRRALLGVTQARS